MKRCLFNALVGVSLALVLATLILWIRTHSVGEDWEVVHFGRDHAKGGTLLDIDFRAYNGVVMLWAEWAFIADADAPFGKFKPAIKSDKWIVGWDYVHERPYDWRPNPTNRWERLGFDLDDETYSDNDGWARIYIVGFPYWLILIVTAALPAWMVLLANGKHRKKKSGRCPACGYDLRATPNRCPECGAVPMKVVVGK
jgi:hypothetical protein